MARKHNARGGFRGLRVELNDFSGEVNLRIPYRHLSEILTAAAMNCFDSIEKAEKGERNNTAEVLAYHKGLHRYIKGIENFLEADLSPETGARNLGIDPLTRKRSVKERRETIKRTQADRKLFASMLSKAHAMRDAKKAK